MSLQPPEQPIVDLRVHEVSPEENRPSPEVLRVLAIELCDDVVSVGLCSTG
ncbi:MAG: hypothetical protein KME16_21230 [Scytolyngbya sp. HA4215-MV1]|jgi:hypothetical protein|nr:hypothetical protein [Scytolyngbya sp. HA4215-MV1]